MGSYILNVPCGICVSDTTMCPLKYKCGHIFCMQCVYPNRKHTALRKCPLCRKIDPLIALTNSPIYYLGSDDNFEQFYSDFTRKELSRINASELVDKLGKCVAIEYTIHDQTKNTVQCVSYIGTLIFYTGLKMTLSNCHHLNRDMRQIYPTMPDIRNNLIIRSDSVVYAEN